MRRRHVAQVDEASLQTDVMRFMAIVAFCLIAILAMVRNIEAPPSAPAGVETVQVVQAEPVQAEPVHAEPVQAEPEPESVQEPLQTTPPEPLTAAPEPPPQPTRSEEMADPEPRPFVEVTMPMAAPAAPPPQPSAAETEAQPEEVVAEVTHTPDVPADEGLTLRFASEADFLRLVARGKVAVYAYSDTDFLELKSNFQFADAAPPEQVYELEATTIPRQMHAALSRSGRAGTPDEHNMKWAVGLPRRVQRQIHEWVNNVESGELLINRFEEVHHVALR